MDHEAQAKSRVYSEYSSKPNLLNWIGINGVLGNDIEAVYQDVLESYNIDTAGTDELNVLGKIVVIGRALGTFLKSNAYLFGGGGGAQFGFAQFRDGTGVEDKQLNNDVYRLLIKSKIAKNTNDATLDGIITALQVMVETDEVSINDPEDMTFSLVFKSLTYLEKVVLTNFDLIPKPQGVRYTGFYDLTSMTQFGRHQFGSSQFSYKTEA